MHRHDSRVTVEGISKRLATIGFKKIGKVRYAGGDRQANAWESPQGFMNEPRGTTHYDNQTFGLIGLRQGG